MKKIALFFLLILLLPSLLFATNYYVDCSANSNGNGSFASPWNNIPSINSFSFSTSDGVYFKVNTICYLNADSDKLQVDWSGTSGNRAIIGAYYGNGQFGLNGNDRPIIDGKSLYPGQWEQAIEVKNRSFVTIKDLRVQKVGGNDRRARAIGATDSGNINVENCYMYRTHGCSMVYMRVNTGQIIDNVVEQSKYPDYKGTGAAIEVSAGNNAGATTNILVARNKVFESAHEGIGLYKGVTNSTVEYNIVRDTQSFMIYASGAKNCIFRYNLSYDSTVNSSDNGKGNFGPDYGLASSIEINFPNEDAHGGNQWYGNFVAGARYGISFGCGARNVDPDIVCHPNEKVYNNTFVDCINSIAYWRDDSRDNVYIKNNISLKTPGGTGGHIYLNNYSPAGVTWSHNLFHGGTLPTGNAATNAVFENPKLVKQYGWRDIAPDSISIEDFKLLSGSPAIDAGTMVE